MSKTRTMLVAALMLSCVVAVGTGSQSAPPEQPPPQISDIPPLPGDDTIIRTVERAFLDPWHRCDRLMTDPRWHAGIRYVIDATCLVAHEYRELPGYEGSVVIALAYPPDDLTVLTAGHSPGPEHGGSLTTWVYSPSFDVFGERLGMCREWETLDVPGATQGVGCTTRFPATASWIERRVVVVSDEVLVFVNVRAERLESNLTYVDDEAVDFVHELAIATAERLLAVVP